jgi:hypothetical protein
MQETSLALSMDPKIWSQLLNDVLLKIINIQSMDVKLWSHLPNDMLLEIYKRVPLKDFSRLRVVCKEWNQMAQNWTFSSSF